jgi:uncharacterized protein
MKTDRQLVLVTGGSSGIGKEIARLFLRKGARVVLVADGPAKLQVAERELSAISDQVASVVCDVGDPDSVVAMSENVLTRFGCPDILVNNAGFVTYRVFEEMPLEEIERLISVNLLGHMRCTRAFTPYMTRRRSGVIVNVASIAGLVPISPNGVYGAAKHGLVVWSETLRNELKRFGISVVVVCPGRVSTGLFDHGTFRERQAGIETRHMMSAADVALATVRGVERGQHKVFMPGYLGPLLWMSRLVPPVSEWLLGALIRRRTEEIYRRKVAASSERVAR